MLIILDRDGVINEDSPDYIKNPDEWIAIPSSLTAIARLNQLGHQVIVATNQSGVGRGYYTEATLGAIHEKMRNALAEQGGHVDAIYYCPHTPDDHCECRKPKPGMLKKIAEDLKADLSTAILVGDSLRDLQAAQAVHCKPVLVCTGKGEATLAADKGLENVPVYLDLNDFVKSFEDNGY